MGAGSNAHQDCFDIQASIYTNAILLSPYSYSLLQLTSQSACLLDFWRKSVHPEEPHEIKARMCKAHIDSTGGQD